MESKTYNKLVSKTKKKQTHRYGEQSSDYQWEEGRGRGNIGVGDKRVIMGLHEIMCMKL